METIYLYIIVFLAICIAILWFLLFQKRQQIYLFNKALKKKQTENNFTPLFVQSFSPDIVELANQINETIARQKKLHILAVQSEERLKQMIAGISHDFRTPLTAIMGYLQMMEQGGRLEPEDRESLRIAMERCQHLYKLSDDFFELSKLSADDTGMKLEVVEITKLLIEECLLAHEWISERKIAAEFNLPDEPVTVWGQEHALKRVVANLFSNIRKYAKNLVRISLEAEGEVVKINFINDMDSDCDEEFCTHVFEPFYRSSSRHGQGSGLGLYVVKYLVEKMEGSVEASCENGIFTIVVYLKKGDKHPSIQQSFPAVFPAD